MPPSKRAKIFSMFDALKGLKEALAAKERIPEERKILAADAIEELNRIRFSSSMASAARIFLSSGILSFAARASLRPLSASNIEKILARLDGGMGARTCAIGFMPSNLFISFSSGGCLFKVHTLENRVLAILCADSQQGFL